MQLEIYICIYWSIMPYCRYIQYHALWFYSSYRQYTMHYALCSIDYALCTIDYALRITDYVWCTIDYALCTIDYALRITSPYPTSPSIIVTVVFARISRMCFPFIAFASAMHCPCSPRHILLFTVIGCTVRPLTGHLESNYARRNEI